MQASATFLYEVPALPFPGFSPITFCTLKWRYISATATAKHPGVLQFHHAFDSKSTDLFGSKFQIKRYKNGHRRRHRKCVLDSIESISEIG